MSRSLALVGAPGSPYTRKMRALMRYRRIPFRFIQRGSPEDQATPDIPVQLIPILVIPGESKKPDKTSDTAVVDSTPMLRQLETMHQGRAVVPTDPALAFLNALIEDYADEWLTKAMFHYRWVYQPDIDKAGSVLPRWRKWNAPEEEINPLSESITKRQVSRLWVVGSNQTTGPVIEESYRRLLRLLDAHLTEHRFVLGSRPSSCDFALYGQLTQLVSFDPTPMAEALATPRIIAWVEVLEDLSGIEVSERDWLSSRRLPASLRALLIEVGRVYTPFLLANARALEAGEERVECEIDGKPWVQRTFPYQAKCLRWLRSDYARLDGEDRETVESALEGTGCEALFADL